jgi:hypothetical protein
MSLHITSANTEAAFLSRVIQGTQREDLSRSAAGYLLCVGFAERDVNRVNELSEAARQSELTTGAQAELDSYLDVSNVLIICRQKDAAPCNVLLNKHFER